MNLNSKILITGGKGFLGKAVCDCLKKKGYVNIIAVEKENYDLTNELEVARLFEENGPIDVVIHLASIFGGIGFNKENPGMIYYKNTMVNTLVQEYSLRNKVSKFIGIGSSVSYPFDTPVPFKEEYFWKGSPEEDNVSYALTKRMMLVQSEAYRKQYGFNAIHLILANLYGPGYDINSKNLNVIPNLIKKIARKDPVINIWGTGNVSREFLYVGDAASAIVLAMESYNKSDPINIGSGHETKIRELVESLIKISGYNGKVEWDKSKPEGHKRRSLDVSKAKREFNYASKIDLEEGLKRTWDWYFVQCKKD